MEGGFDRFGDGHLADPYPLYERVRERGAFLDPALDLWIVGRYGDVRTVLADHERFSSDFPIRTPPVPAPEVAAVLATGHPEVPALLNQDPPEHTAVRAVVAAAFSPRRVRELTPTVRRLAAGLVDGFAGAGEGDLVAELARPLPLAVMCALLGFPEQDAPRVRAGLDALTGLNAYGTPLADQVAAAHGSVALERYLAGFVAERRADPGDDLTSALVTSSGLTDDELISLLISLVFAGNETTANLVASTLLAVLAEPADDPVAEPPAQPAAQPAADPVADPVADLDAAVERTLQRDPPVQGMYRRAVVDADVGGVTIPAGAMVFALIGAANRDPGGGRHLGFGAGVHYCLGAQLSRMEATVVVGTVLDRLPGLRLAPGFVPPYPPSLMHRGPQQLPATWAV